MRKKAGNKRTTKTLVLFGGMVFLFVALIVWINVRSTTIAFLLDEHPADREAMRQDQEQNGFFAMLEAFKLLPAKLRPHYAPDPDKPNDFISHDIEAHSLGKLLYMARPDFHPHMLAFMAASEPAIKKVKLALEKPYSVSPVPLLVRSPYYETFAGSREHRYLDIRWLSHLLMGTGLVELLHNGNEERATELIHMSFEVVLREEEFQGEFYEWNDTQSKMKYLFASIHKYAKEGTEKQAQFLRKIIEDVEFEFDPKSVVSFYRVVDNTIWFPSSHYYDNENANIGDSIEQTIFRGKFAEDVEYLRANMKMIEELYGLSFVEKRKWFDDPKNDVFLRRERSDVVRYDSFGRKVQSLLTVNEYLETERRTTLLALDIELFKRTTGVYPKSLDEIGLTDDCEYLNDALAENRFVYELHEQEGEEPVFWIYQDAVPGWSEKNKVFGDEPKWVRQKNARR